MTAKHSERSARYRLPAGRFLLAAAGLLALLSIPAASASAHTLKTDGHISAVLHVNPDDNPVSGGPTTYLLFFGDDTQRLDLRQCTCTVYYSEKGKIIAAAPLKATQKLFSENTYTFAEPAVYTLHITGLPKNTAGFQPFSLTYEVRVTKGNAPAQSMPAAVWAGMVAVIGGLVLVSYIMNAKAHRKEHK